MAPGNSWKSMAALICGIWALATPPAAAQQFNLYDVSPDPFLLLLREPAVWDDLKLKEPQRDALGRLNRRVDGPLWALRNQPPEAADKTFRELVADSQQSLAKLLSGEQRERLRQVQLRVRGIECVGDDSVAKALALDESQRDAIRGIVDEVRRDVAKLRERVRAGEAREPLEKEHARLQADEQKRILAELSAGQRQQLAALVGRVFDVRQLGRVSFQAPEFPAGNEWFPTEPLTFEQLKGKVVALHFWTFG